LQKECTKLCGVSLFASRFLGSSLRLHIDLPDLPLSDVGQDSLGKNTSEGNPRQGVFQTTRAKFDEQSVDDKKRDAQLCGTKTRKADLEFRLG